MTFARALASLSPTVDHSHLNNVPNITLSTFLRCVRGAPNYNVRVAQVVAGDVVPFPGKIYANTRARAYTVKRALCKRQRYLAKSRAAAAKKPYFTHTTQSQIYLIYSYIVRNATSKSEYDGGQFVSLWRCLTPPNAQMGKKANLIKR